MTTSVTVKARAHGAKVTINGESQDIDANTEKKFHLNEGDTISVEQGPAPVPEAEQEPALRTGLDPRNVPGRAENDKLVPPGGVGAAKTNVDTAQA